MQSACRRSDRQNRRFNLLAHYACDLSNYSRVRQTPDAKAPEVRGPGEGACSRMLLGSQRIRIGLRHKENLKQSILNATTFEILACVKI